MPRHYETSLERAEVPRRELGRARRARRGRADERAAAVARVVVDVNVSVVAAAANAAIVGGVAAVVRVDQLVVHLERGDGLALQLEVERLARARERGPRWQ